MLKELHINSVHELESLSINMCSLQVLTIKKCKELINVVSESSTRLRRIEIQDCNKLKSLWDALHNLPFLEELNIENCEELDCKALTDVDQENIGTSGATRKGIENFCLLKLTNISKWETLLRGLNCFATLQKLSLNWYYKLRLLPESIRHLTRLQWLAIRHFPNLVKLPESLGQLSSLQYMEIQDCPRLKQLPESYPNLMSLQQIEIIGCLELKRRYQQLNGKYWPLIKDMS